MPVVDENGPSKEVISETLSKASEILSEAKSAAEVPTGANIQFSSSAPLPSTGQSRQFSTGAHRDSDAGKPRLDLASPFAKERLGILLARGVAKFGDRNWEKGMPLGQFLASAERHLNAFKKGDTSEDHLAAIVFNIDAIMHGQEMIARGRWPAEYNDIPNYDAKRS